MSRDLHIVNPVTQLAMWFDLILLICSILRLYFAIGSRSTNNSLQTAPVYQMAGRESGLGTSTSHTVTLLDDLPTTSQAVVSGGEGGISPALALFIAQFNSSGCVGHQTIGS